MAKIAKKPLVVILTAGKGSRMGAQGKKLNKSLFPYKDMAIISHIILKFEKQTEFVIAVGFLKDQVKNYLNLAHPSNDIKYVDVPVWKGKGSGPGASLLACEEYLSRSFHVFACDGIWPDVKAEYASNVLTVAAPMTDTDSFCNIVGNDGIVASIYDKKIPPKKKVFFTFTGHAFIKDHSLFLKALRESKNTVQGEVQIIEGFYALLVKKNLRYQTSTWFDVGTWENYKSAISRNSTFDFSKVDEYFYKIQNRIIKFFNDEKLSQDRYERALQNLAVFPKKLQRAGQFYSYQYQKGSTFYVSGTPLLLSRLLTWADKHLWIKKSVEPAAYATLCKKFYHWKTLDRLELYLKKYPHDDKIKTINDHEVPGVLKLLNEINWDNLSEGIPTFFHGDFQFDNIIVNEDSFTMIDWRQNFSGSTEVGDQYYDLAKLLGGIRLQYDLIKKGLFWVKKNKNSVTYDFAQRYSATHMEDILKTFVQKKNLDWKKLNLITAIIYLNMAPLHEAPFSNLLFFNGKKLLQDIHLNENF